MLILMAGLPGSGKSTLARALAASLSGVVLNKDEIRAAVFSPLDIEYSCEQDDFIQDMMLQAAEFILRKQPERHVFLDGRTFSRRYQIDRVLDLAARLDQPWRILECVCSDQTAHNRITTQQHPAKDRDYDLYLRVKARFEPIALPKTVVDSNHAQETCLNQALAAIQNS